jgi:hypothetical protein
MGFILDAVFRHTTEVRKQVLVSKTAKRVAMAVLVFSIAVVCIYPPRPFVYNENGHWISKSKAAVMGSESRYGYRFVQAEHPLGLHDSSAVGRGLSSRRDESHSSKQFPGISMRVALTLVNMQRWRSKSKVVACIF